MSLTYTDYVEQTQVCPPVVKVACLIVLYNFTFSSGFSFIKDRYFCIYAVDECLSSYNMLQLCMWAMSTVNKNEAWAKIDLFLSSYFSTRSGPKNVKKTLM